MGTDRYSSKEQGPKILMYEGIKPKVGLKIRLGVDYPVDHMGSVKFA